MHLDGAEGWTTRQEMEVTAGLKGFSEALGPATKTLPPDSLEARGLVERRDGRIPFAYRLTTKGRELLRQASVVVGAQISLTNVDELKWKRVLNAALSFGRPVSIPEVQAKLLERDPFFASETVGPDLRMLAVNEKNRVHYNQKARVVDRVQSKDQLYRVGAQGAPLFEAFDPIHHGIWEIVGDGEPKTRVVRQRHPPAEVEIDRSSPEDIDFMPFNPATIVDDRQYTVGSIKQRRGQPAFRLALLNAYGRTCAVTGSTVESILEAAHIFPHMGNNTNVVSNGLLLRADIHTLYDLLLLRINAEFFVEVAPSLLGTEYENYAGRPMRLPKDRGARPSKLALDAHFNRCESTFNACPPEEPVVP